MRTRSGVTVRPVSVLAKPGLRDVLALQEELIKDFVEAGVAIGTLLACDRTWKNCEKLAKILPVVGSDQPGIDIRHLAEMGDLRQLGHIFFSEAFDEDLTLAKEYLLDHENNPILMDGRPVQKAAKPSAIARIHGMDFHSPLYRFLEEKERREEEERRVKEIEKLNGSLKLPETSPLT